MHWWICKLLLNEDSHRHAEKEKSSGFSTAILRKEQKSKGENSSRKDKFNPIQAPQLSRETKGIHCPLSGQFFQTNHSSFIFRREALKTTGWKRIKVFVAMAIHFPATPTASGTELLPTGSWKSESSSEGDLNLLWAGSNGESVLWMWPHQANKSSRIKVLQYMEYTVVTNSQRYGALQRAIAVLLLT